MSKTWNAPAWGLLLCASGLGSVACEDDSGVVQLESRMEVGPLSLDFGRVQVGTSAERPILVRNAGSAVLSLRSVSAVAGSDEAFSFEVDRSTVAPGAAATILVRFRPTELGERSARIRVTPGDEALEAVELVIAGSGVTATLVSNPSALAFGNVIVHTRKALPITLTNQSAVDASVEYLGGQNLRLCGASGVDAAPFCLRMRERPLGVDRRFRLAAGESIEAEVEFSPTTAGNLERGTLTFRACESAACELQVALQGTGIEQGFRCAPGTLDFGRVNPRSCLTRTVQCENIANEPVTVLSWSIDATTAEFTSEPSRVRTLEEGESLSIDVTYCPTALGADGGRLDIETNNNDPRSRRVAIPLTGTGGGPNIELLPTQLNFGLVSLIAPARRTVLVANTGHEALEVSEIIADGAGTGAFSTPSAGGARIEPGESLAVTVEFQPLAEGPVESRLIVRSNDADEPEASVRLLGEGISLPPCSYQVAPSQVAFGAVERGRALTRAFEIRNTGTHDCLVTSARLLAGSDPAFTLPDGDVISRIIPAGAAATVRTQFAPTDAGSRRGTVEFSISHPTTPFNEVELSGTGAEATLLILPNDLDFGVIGAGCAARSRLVQIYNTGGTPAQIHSITLAAPHNPAFSLRSLPAPLPGGTSTIPPGLSAEFEVGFRAERVSSYASAVEISATFAGAPATYVVSLYGRGDVDAVQVDEFVQLGTPKVDILLVVDDSCSMSSHQDSLARNFADFIRFASAQSLDYQIGVTSMTISGPGAHGTAEAGRLVHRGGNGSPFAGPVQNKIVTPYSSPSAEAVFATNVRAGAISPGTAQDESGLEAAYLALSNPLISGHNAGFIRPDAVLSIIFVTDAGDQSNRSVDFYANFFMSIKGFRNHHLFTASTIGPPETPPAAPCSLDPHVWTPERYLEVANRTGGLFESICTTDWSRSLENLSTTAFGFKSRFFLSNQPVFATLRVFVDGIEMPAVSPQGSLHWTFDRATNSLNFMPFTVPEPGAQIRVEYQNECL